MKIKIKNHISLKSNLGKSHDFSPLHHTETELTWDGMGSWMASLIVCLNNVEGDGEQSRNKNPSSSHTQSAHERMKDDVGQ